MKESVKRLTLNVARSSIQIKYGDQLIAKYKQNVDDLKKQIENVYKNKKEVKSLKNETLELDIEIKSKTDIRIIDKLRDQKIKM